MNSCSGRYRPASFKTICKLVIWHHKVWPVTRWYEEHPDFGARSRDQKAIADFLDRETGRIDDLKAKTLASIDRLREYRAALITAAVTGQIDVTAGNVSGAAQRRLEAIQVEAPA